MCMKILMKLFFVIEGTIGIEFEDKIIELDAGEMIVIPRGMKHKPFAKKEAKIMLFEPKGVINTGHIESELTATKNEWV